MSNKNNKTYLGQYDTSGTLIAIYCGYRDAATAIDGDAGNIWRATHGKQKTSKGFLWKTLNEEEYNELLSETIN